MQTHRPRRLNESWVSRFFGRGGSHVFVARPCVTAFPPEWAASSARLGVVFSAGVGSRFFGPSGIASVSNRVEHFGWSGWRLPQDSRHFEHVYNHRLLHSPRAGSTDGRWRRRSGHTRLDMQNFDRAIRLIRTCRKGERDHGAGNNALCRTPRWRAKCATTKTANAPSRGCRSRRQSPLHHLSGLQSSVQLHRQ